METGDGKNYINADVMEMWGVLGECRLKSQLRKRRDGPSYIVKASIVERAIVSTQVPRTLAKTSGT